MTQDNAKPSWHQQVAEDLVDPVMKDLTWHGRTTDWFLQDLVQLTNETELQVGITLSTPAGIISGILISVEQYFRLFGEAFASSWPVADADRLRAHYAELGKSRLPKTDGETPPPVQYLHLKDAKLSTPSGQMPATEGLLWRGTIASISGFSLGLLADDLGDDIQLTLQQ
jgi:hypothetical protein